jgi:hypothetical protein
VPTLRAKHYDETESRLASDPIVLEMARGLVTVPRDQMAHEDGSPRFEFMQAANAQYRKMGGCDGGHIGAVASALLRVVP